MLTKSSLMRAQQHNGAYGLGQHRFGASSGYVPRNWLRRGDQVRVQFDSQGRVKTFDIQTGAYVWLKLIR